jgi:hypothetical protein
LLVKNDWTLELNKSDEDLDLGLADFYWRSDDVMPAMIVPPQDYDLSEYHPTLQKFYALVDHVHWCPWGNSGGFWDATSHVTPYEADHHGDSITLDETVQWGADLNGNQLIYTTDGRAGRIKLTSAQVRLLGSIEDTINWVFGELLARREPRWNEEWSAERR